MMNRYGRFRILSSTLLASAGAAQLGCAIEPGTPSGGGDDFAETEQPLLLSGVTLRTELQSRYVGAQNNGGGAVVATATSAQGWETLSLDDINGGLLVSGDSVRIRAGNGQYFQALNGGGSSLSASSNNAPFCRWQLDPPDGRCGVGGAPL